MAEARKAKSQPKKTTRAAAKKTALPRIPVVRAPHGNGQGTLATIVSAFKSVAVGLGITARRLPKRAVTLQYPEERPDLAPRFRGALRLTGMMGESEMEMYRTLPPDYNARIAERMEEGLLPPCVGSCPANVDARGQNALVAEGRHREALELVRQRNILPGVLGRICHHPCEDSCNRAYYDQALNIRGLHRFISDYCMEAGTSAPDPAPKKSDKKVAVIGAGPAGLAAAQDLVMLGYRVTVYDKRPTGGGALLTGVPCYRLPKDRLKFEFEQVLARGIEFVGDVEIGRNLSFEELRGKGFDAVLIAVGLQISRGIPIPGADLPGVLLALPFLEAANSGTFTGIGRHVIVIGGGNVAIDVARLALRAGADTVQMSCLEGSHEMPAHKWEIEEAKEEGIKIHYSRGPKAVTGKDKVTGLDVIECTAVFDAEGRFNPQFCEEHKFHLEGDTVIFSIGQGSELSFLKDSGVELNERGQLVVDRQTNMTTLEGVFSAGEVMTGPGSAIGSIASGHQAAVSIDRYLRGEELTADRVYPIAPNFEKYGALSEEPPEDDRKRQELPLTDPQTRMRSMDEIEFTLPEDLAVMEGERCLRCLSGVCVGCRFCERKCPDYAIMVERTPAGAPERKVTRWDLDITKCMFCGMCADQCPTKALEMGPEFELSVYSRDGFTYGRTTMLREEVSGKEGD